LSLCLCVDFDGLLHITDRIKELVITALVPSEDESLPLFLPLFLVVFLSFPCVSSPACAHSRSLPLPQTMKEEMPLISNVMVVGDRKKFLSMLVALKTDVNADGVPQSTLSPDALRILST
jgi:hypothetical protein